MLVLSRDRDQNLYGCVAAASSLEQKPDALFGFVDPHLEQACGSHVAILFALYIPFQLYKLSKGDTWLALGALLVNVVVVGLMIRTLLGQRRTEPN